MLTNNSLIKNSCGKTLITKEKLEVLKSLLKEDPNDQ